MKKYDTKEITISRIADKIDNIYKECYWDFYDPTQQININRYLKNKKEVCFKFYGGHNFCERKILGIYPNFIDNIFLSWPISVIHIPKKYEVNHRDVLGSVLALGIKREKIGDINIFENLIQVFVKSNISDYIVLNLEKIANYRVKPYIMTLDEVIEPKIEYSKMCCVVPSFRVDAIMSSVYGISRKNASEKIKAGSVKVNHEYINKNDYILKIGDLISLRGKGRFIFNKINGKTKKEKIRIEIFKYK